MPAANLWWACCSATSRYESPDRDPHGPCYLLLIPFGPAFANSKNLHLRSCFCSGMMSFVIAGELQYKDITCLGHLKRVFELLDRLHEVGCERDTAGNRQLHFDGYCKLVLLHIWNPL